MGGEKERIEMILLLSEGTKPVPDVTKQAWPCGIVYLCP